MRSVPMPTRQTSVRADIYEFLDPMCRDGEYSCWITLSVALERPILSSSAQLMNIGCQFAPTRSIARSGSDCRCLMAVCR